MALVLAAKDLCLSRPVYGRTRRDSDVRSPDSDYRHGTNLTMKKGVRPMAWGIIMTGMMLVGMLALLILKSNLAASPPVKPEPAAVALSPLKAA